MKIISLNIRWWRMFDNLKEFIITHKDTTDIFCFQEVMRTISDQIIVDEYYRANIYNELCNLLPDFVSYYAPYTTWWFDNDVNYHLEWGNAIFARRTIGVQSTGIQYFWYYTPANDQNKNFQYITLNYEWKIFSIVNIHWLRTGTGKDDTPQRIEQFTTIKDFTKQLPGQIIIMGDFNLNPDTQSLAILESWMKNLISEYNIQSTRSKLYRQYGQMHFADYAIISPDIIIKDFTVPYSEASDHLPLILEIE